MNYNLILKYLTIFLREYIFIFLTATIFLFTTYTKSFSDENVFTVNNVKVKGTIDLNFNREKYINKAFTNSFKTLMRKILLARDIKKTNDITLKEIKSLINSFQITEENYSKNEYAINLKILYNDKKIKKFLAKKNISFSQPDNVSVVFYPILFVNDEIKNFSENLFYKQWPEVEIENETINFILPLEDIDDLSEIIKAKDRIENLDIANLIKKYDIENYIFVLMNYQKKILNIYLKINFNNNIISRNISYKINNINNQIELVPIIEDLKLKINDIWKEENLVNLLMPLNINLKFEHKNLNNLEILRNTFKKISIVENYTLEEFNINDSFFKIYYYGDPKKLRSELLKFGYKLENVQGLWQLYLNE